jgi:hypothetical protein
MRRLVFNNFVRPQYLVAVAALLLVSFVPALAQNPGFDLFSTGSGSSVTLDNIGAVPLQGVAIQGSTGNTDTIIQRTQSVPPGGGSVNVTVFALFMKSTSPVNFNGTSADVYVTINNSGGQISTSVLPQPDSLSASAGTVTVRNDGTFDSKIVVNADVIFVKRGASVTDPNNYLGHQAGPSVTMSSSNSTWTETPPPGYPSAPGFPPGGFFPNVVNGHLIPPHVHPILVAKCGGIVVGGATRVGTGEAITPVKACVVATH